MGPGGCARHRGSTAAQIVESVAASRIVRHVVSARDEAEFGLLMKEAQRLLEIKSSER